jgi:hypothetical protein
MAWRRGTDRNVVIGQVVVVLTSARALQKAGIRC